MVNDWLYVTNHKNFMISNSNENVCMIGYLRWSDTLVIKSHATAPRHLL